MIMRRRFSGPPVKQTVSSFVSLGDVPTIAARFVPCIRTFPSQSIRTRLWTGRLPWPPTMPAMKYAFVLPTEKLLALLARLYGTFPNLQRVTSYAGPKDILRKSDEELLRLREAGLKMLYFGLETGDSQLLQQIQKGVTAEESIAAGQKVVRSGMKLSMMVIAGLGGAAGSARHALKTAYAVSQIQPDMLSVLTLRLYKGTQMLREFEEGKFELLSPCGLAEEVMTFLSHIELPPNRHCLFRSNHISNYVPLKGTLPKDRDRLLQELDVSIGKLSKLTDWEVYTNMEY